MADESLAELGGFDVSSIFNIVSYIGQGLLIIAILAVLAGLAYMVKVFIFDFKHHIRIRNITGERILITDDRFKVFTDNDGVNWYKLKKRKEIIPVAPSECIDLNHKGQMMVEVYFTPDGDRVYQHEKLTPEVLSMLSDANGAKKHPERYKGSAVYMFANDANRSVASLDPFPTNERALLVNQIRKGEEERGFKFTDHLPAIASGLMVMFVFFMVLVFWEDVTKPSIEFADRQVELSANQAQIAEAQRDAALQIQTLSQEVTARVQQEAPS